MRKLLFEHAVFVILCISTCKSDIQAAIFLVSRNKPKHIISKKDIDLLQKSGFTDALSYCSDEYWLEYEKMTKGSHVNYLSALA